MIDMFIKCIDMPSADKVFDRKLKKNLIDYSAMMKGYNRSGQPMKTWSLFQEIEIESIVRDYIIVAFVIDACSQISESFQYVEQSSIEFHRLFRTFVKLRTV